MKPFALIVMFLLSQSALALPAVTIFTSHSRPAQGIDRTPATVYYLDDAAILNHKMSVGLPKNREDAQREVLQRLNSVDGARYLKEIGPASEHLVIAWMWGIRAVPAVVIEDKGIRSVVYGTANSSEALAIWAKAMGYQ